MINILLSILVGAILGFLYALSAFAQKQVAISLFAADSKKNAQFKVIIFSFLRLFIIFIILYCLSGLQNINFIITVITFIIIFWTVALKIDPSNYFKI